MPRKIRFEDSIKVSDRAIEEIVAWLKRFDETVAVKNVETDPEFQKIVDKSLGGYTQLVGQDAQAAFNQVLNVPKKDKDWLINWIETKYEIKVR